MQGNLKDAFRNTVHHLTELLFSKNKFGADDPQGVGKTSGGSQAAKDAAKVLAENDAPEATPMPTASPTPTSKKTKLEKDSDDSED